MTFDSWSAIDSGDSVIRNRKITTVVLVLVLAPQGKQEMRHRLFRSLCDYVVMELVDGQDDEAANRQKDRDHRQRNLVVRPWIIFHWMARSPCKDGSASEEPADDAIPEKKGF
jgi:hypothetical protein